MKQAIKALRALKGVIRLQAIIRGQAVRRQVFRSLKSVPSNAKEKKKIDENELKVNVFKLTYFNLSKTRV